MIWMLADTLQRLSELRAFRTGVRCGFICCGESYTGMRSRETKLSKVEFWKWGWKETTSRLLQSYPASWHNARVKGFEYGNVPANIGFVHFPPGVLRPLGTQEEETSAERSGGVSNGGTHKSPRS